jgi:hypothetical protein
MFYHSWARLTNIATNIELQHDMLCELQHDMLCELQHDMLCELQNDMLCELQHDMLCELQHDMLCFTTLEPDWLILQNTAETCALRLLKNLKSLIF